MLSHGSGASHSVTPGFRREEGRGGGRATHLVDVVVDELALEVLVVEAVRPGLLRLGADRLDLRRVLDVVLPQVGDVRAHLEAAFLRVFV